MVLTRALRSHQYGGPSKVGSQGASMWPARDRPCGVVVRGMPGQKAAMHLIPDEGGVPGEMMLELVHGDL
jgi:hypothetical protein